LRLFEVRQEPLAAIVVGPADFGQAHPAGRAVEQPRPEPLLELLDVLAHHARREAEARRRGREAARLYDLGEDPHALETIHASGALLLISHERHIQLNADYLV